jgi:hypothetical protein
MIFLFLRQRGVFVAFLVLFVSGMLIHAEQVSQADGTLVLEVMWGDIGNTPANDVYVEAYGFVPKYRSEKSYVLKMSHDGEYKASLPPGVYDVFVSEGTSVPRCRRLRIREGLATYWTLKLEIDDVYTNTSTQRPTR